MERQHSYPVLKSITWTEQNIVKVNRAILFKNMKTLICATILLIYAVPDCKLYLIVSHDIILAQNKIFRNENDIITQAVFHFL